MTRLTAARLGYAVGERHASCFVFTHPLWLSSFIDPRSDAERRADYLRRTVFVRTYAGLHCYMSLGIFKIRARLTPQAVGMLAATGAIRRAA